MPPSSKNVKLVNGLEFFDVVKSEIGKKIVGMDLVLEKMVVAILAQGHVLLEGMPGLAKTLLAFSMSECLDLNFKRIQFTPDLMPSDITGTEILQENKTSGERVFRFINGPIFANLVLADEINRTPPKTQSALLEAMQELQVTVGGQRHILPKPFFVLATQNPIEQEGTYPLPEAQLDRFMFMILVGYPSEAEELEIISRTTSGHMHPVQRVLSEAEIQGMQELVCKIPASPHVVKYAMDIVRKSRPERDKESSAAVPDFVRKYISWGAGPRAGQAMVMAGKARAALAGRFFVSREDIKAVALPILRHRIITNYHAESDGMTADKIVQKLIDSVPLAEI
jgi:MoxR-like ATPase